VDQGRDQTIFNDTRSFSINFLGLLDSRKTVHAIKKRRATFNLSPTVNASNESENLSKLLSGHRQSGDSEGRILQESEALRDSDKTSR